MTKHTLKLANDKVRAKALTWINAAPEGTIVTFQPEPTRSLEQNSKLWAMLGDISKQLMHNGKRRSPESWKLLVMHACKYECSFEVGLNGEPFPAGFRSSQLSVRQMAELIEWIYAYGAENGIVWSKRGFDNGEA